jgi:hypothetical protein
MKYGVCTENNAVPSREVHHLCLYFAEYLPRNLRRSRLIGKLKAVRRFEFGGSPNCLNAIAERFNAFLRNKDRPIHEELLASALLCISLITQH